MSVYTTADLIDSVKQRVMLPDASTGSLSPDNLLSFATEELLSGIVPMILSVREKYYETYTDQLITPNIAAYAIPQRAIGGVLSAVQWVYGTNIIPLNPLEPTSITTVLTAPSPRGFYFENGNVILYPTPSTSNYTLRLRYFQRPSRLTQIANCARVTSFDPIAFTAEVSAVPSGWTVGTSVDFVPTSMPFTPYGLDYAISNVVGNVISFASLPAKLSVGDYIAPAEYTPIPELPNEFLPVLAQATACRALEAIGDEKGLMAASETLKTKAQNAVRLITPRDQLGSKKVLSGWRNL